MGELQNKQEEQFDKLWEVYPKRVEKQASIKQWAKLKPDENLYNIIMEAVIQQKNTKQWQNKKFIPSLRRWLFNRRWEDEITKEDLEKEKVKEEKQQKQIESDTEQKRKDNEAIQKELDMTPEQRSKLLGYFGCVYLAKTGQPFDMTKKDFVIQQQKLYFDTYPQQQRIGIKWAEAIIEKLI